MDNRIDTSIEADFNPFLQMGLNLYNNRNEIEDGEGILDYSSNSESEKEDPDPPDQKILVDQSPGQNDQLYDQEINSHEDSQNFI
jgi:hypothetical protein